MIVLLDFKLRLIDQLNEEKGVGLGSVGAVELLMRVFWQQLALSQPFFFLVRSICGSQASPTPTRLPWPQHHNHHPLLLSSCVLVFRLHLPHFIGTSLLFVASHQSSSPQPLRPPFHIRRSLLPENAARTASSSTHWCSLSLVCIVAVPLLVVVRLLLCFLDFGAGPSISDYLRVLSIGLAYTRVCNFL